MGKTSMDLEKYNNIRDRALKSSDPDEVAKIMDEMEPWDYPALGLYELVMHLRAALYKNIAHMFLGIELTFGSEDVEIVGEITDRLKANLDEKGNILPEIDEDIKNMLTWLASLEGELDIYEPKRSSRIIKRYIDYAGGMLCEIYIKQLGFEWALSNDADIYVLKNGNIEIAEPSDCVLKQLLWNQQHNISSIYERFRKAVKDQNNK